MTIELIGPTFKPQDKIIESMCVFFHGWGSNGDDLISLAPIMANVLSSTLFVSPNAPEPCTANPSGRQWFDIMEREEGIDKPIGSIRNYISNLKKAYSIKNDKIFLFGFSQGAMIALHYGLRETENFGGILAFSGSLISPQRSSEVKNKTDVLLVHGELDEVVPFQEMQKASLELSNINISVEQYSITNLGHGIDNFGISKATEFIKKKIN